MKKFVLGMAIAVTSSVTMNAFAVGTTGAKSVRESLVDYTKQVKEFAFGKGGTGSGLSGQQAKAARDKLVSELHLPSGKANALSIAITSDSSKSGQRLDNLATIIAAKKMAVEIAKQDASEGKSIEEAAMASAKLLANASLTGARSETRGSQSTGSLLSAEETSDTTAALLKLETLPEEILTKFSKAERDSYTQIINRHDKIVEMGTMKTSEEAFIQSIMDVKKVDKAKAMEIAKKLKECV